LKNLSCEGGGSLIQSLREAGLRIMMGHRRVEQAALVYEFSLEGHVSAAMLIVGYCIGIRSERRLYEEVPQPSLVAAWRARDAEQARMSFCAPRPT
jgi:hypothetical protein